MFISRLICLGLLILFSFTFASAQNATESKEEKEKAQKELEKKIVALLEQTVGDAALLKLPENRAQVYATAGDLLWKFDEKRARTLFRNAANELVAAQQQAEKEKQEQDARYYGFDFRDTGRSRILLLVAKHDADLALDLLARTRPQKVTDALAKANSPTTGAKEEVGIGMIMSFSPSEFLVRQELNLEQTFALLAAEQNPDRAIKMIRESLAKGVSHQVWSLIQTLYKKDEEKAKSLAGEVVQKLLDLDVSQKRDERNVIFMLLSGSTKATPSAAKDVKIFKLDDKQIRALADKLADTYLKSGNNQIELAMEMARSMPTLEKLLPEKAPLLKQKQAALNKSLPKEFQRFTTYSKIFNPDAAPEEILSEAQKADEEMRPQFYEMAIHKISQIEDEARAKKLIEQLPDEKYRAKALEEFEAAKIARSAKEGKLEEAQKLIANLTKKSNKIDRLVSLALEFHKKNTEKDRATAAKLMEQARALVSESPENADEIDDLMRVVSGFAIIEPARAFQMIEPIIDEINGLVQAAAILSKFDKNNQTFKQGEILMNAPNYDDQSLLFRYQTQIKSLAKSDFGRVMSLADKFQRADARIIIRLFIAQGVLADEKANEKPLEIYYVD